MKKGNDFLKNYIQQNRERFDDEPLPPELLNRILHKSAGHKKNQTRQTIIYSLMAAASLALIVHFISFSPDESNLPISSETYSAHPATLPGDQTYQAKSSETGENLITEKSTNEIAYQTEKQNLIKPKLPHDKISPPKKKRARNTYAYNKIIADLMKDESVTDRINAMLWAGDLLHPDENLKSLIGKILTTADNSNVRLTALNVLAGYKQDSTTRHYLVKSLGVEEDPLIQLELIHMLRNDPDTMVTKELVNIVRAPYTLPEVKDQAYYVLIGR